MNARKHPDRLLLFQLSAPVIYSVIVPVLLLDLWLELYHRVCFPLYGLPYVMRSQYIRLDRQRLPYLSFMEKLNCLYCGYVNGLFGYAVAIAGRSEEFWCGIRHQTGGLFHAPAHHANFVAYGDEQALDERYHP